MKKRFFITIIILISVFVYFRPDKLLFGMFKNSVSITVPNAYKNKVPRNFLKYHIYSSIPKHGFALSFFRSPEMFFVTSGFNIKNKSSLNFINESPKSLINEVFEVFHFDDTRVLLLNEIKGNQIKSFNIIGNYKMIENKKDHIIIEFKGNAEIASDNLRNIYIESQEIIYLYIDFDKNQLYIIKVAPTMDIKQLFIR